MKKITLVLLLTSPSLVIWDLRIGALGLILVLLLWILEGNWKEKRSNIKQRKRPLIALTALYSIIILAMFFSENMQGAFPVLDICAPLLGFPIIFTSVKLIPKKYIYYTLLTFITSTLIAFGSWIIKVLSGCT